MGSCHAVNFKREVLNASVPCMVMEFALLLPYNWNGKGQLFELGTKSLWLGGPSDVLQLFWPAQSFLRCREAS